MGLLQPRCGAILQFSRELYHCFQFLVGYGASNIVNRFVPLVIEGLESLNHLGAGLYGEFERFDCLNVMTRLGDSAMTRGAERYRCDGKRRVESSDKSKVGRYGFDL